MQKLKDLGQRSLPLLALLVVACLLSVFLPFSDAKWTVVLRDSGNVQLAAWTPTPSPSLTPSPTPTPTPTCAGTTLSAEKSAIGFREQVSGKERVGVRGEICVTNGGTRGTENLKLVDQVQYKDGSGKFQDLVGASKIITPPNQLKPGEKKCVPYEIEVKPISGAIYRNVASVTITNHSGWMPGDENCPGKTPCPFGPQPKADFDLPGTVTKLTPTPAATPSPTATKTSTPTSTFTLTPRAMPSPTATKTSTPTSHSH